jgi:multiple sugar transport system substrate-binding protein
LNAILRPQGIEGVHLVGVDHSPDIEFYPYLWMPGGEIIKQKTGHPTKGAY